MTITGAALATGLRLGHERRIEGVAMSGGFKVWP